MKSRSWKTTVAVQLACLWFFVFPWTVSSLSANTIVILGVGAILAVLALIVSTLEKLSRRQDADAGVAPSLRVPRVADTTE